MGLTTIRDIIAELTRQAAEHQGRRLRLIKQITTDPTYQASSPLQARARAAHLVLQLELKRLQESCGWDSFHGGSESWRVFLDPNAGENVVQARFSPAVNALMSQVHMNEASLSCIRARIEALQTFLLPVLRLPPEVLIHIFKLGSSMPQDDPILGSSIPRPFPLVVSAVCRQWRDIAISTSHLWSNLVIKHPRPSGWVPLSLQRSAGSPVDITIDCRSTSLLTAPVVDQLMTKLVVHIARWRRFCLNSTDPATIYAVGRHLANASAPVLQHLQLSLSGSSGNQEVILPEIFQGGAEALTSVRYDSLCTPWTSRPLVNLTVLDLRWLWLQTRLQYEQFRTVLLASPAIRALILRGTYIHLHSGRQYPALAIPTLRYLELSGDNVCRMSSLLETPGLEELTLANLDETEFREFVASLPIPGDPTAPTTAPAPPPAPAHAPDAPSSESDAAAQEPAPPVPPHHAVRYPCLRALALLNASMCTPTRRFTRALPTITHLTVINSATAKFLQLFREEGLEFERRARGERRLFGSSGGGGGGGSAEGALAGDEPTLSWPRLKKFTFIDEVDYFLLHGVLRARAAAGAPLERLVFNAPPFLHDDNLISSLEELVRVELVKDVDLDH